MTKWMVELVIRGEDGSDVASQVRSIVKEPFIEVEGKVVLTLDAEWAGFRDGTIDVLSNTFGDKMYQALALIIQGDDVRVTDTNGGKVSRFPYSVNGRVGWKYVKKKLLMIRIVDRASDTFYAEICRIDTGLSNPVVKVLDVYSVGSEGGISSQMFYGENTGR